MVDMRQVVHRDRLPGRAPAVRTYRGPGSLAVVIAVLLAGAGAVVWARWWTGTGYQSALFGLPDTGQLTAIGLPLAQFVHELAGIAVVGLLFLCCLMARSDNSSARQRLLTLASRWGWVWAGSTVVWIVFTMSELIGTPVATLPAHGESVWIVLGTSRLSSEIATAWVALAMALFGPRLTGGWPCWLGLLLTTAAMLPAALTGHASHHASPLLASVTLAIHVAASSIWVGGLLALTVHLRLFPEQLRASVARFSAAALICVIAIGASGVVESAVTLNGWATLWGTNRGQLILAKAAALIVLAAIGFLHRRRTVGAAARGQLLPLLRLASWELALMGGTVGIAVVLSTTA